MWENAYLSIKNPKASRALKRALDPSRKLLASLAQLRFAMSATFGLSTWGPPLDQILDPHLDRDSRGDGMFNGGTLHVVHLQQDQLHVHEKEPRLRT